MHEQVEEDLMMAAIIGLTQALGTAKLLAFQPKKSLLPGRACQATRGKF